MQQVEKMGKSTLAFHIFDIPSSLVESAPQQVEQVRQKLQQQKDEVLITFVGSFAVYQGVDLLLKTIPEVTKNCTLARFIIIGGKNDEIEKRETVLQRQGALKAVTFVGMVAPDVLPDYLSASDILLSPRISGVNTPLKILDYFKAVDDLIGEMVASIDEDTEFILMSNQGTTLSKRQVYLNTWL